MHTSCWGARRGDELLPQELICGELPTPFASGCPLKRRRQKMAPSQVPCAGQWASCGSSAL